MAGKRKSHLCSSCMKVKERCRAISVTSEGDIEWCCQECLNNRTDKDGYGHGV